MGRTKKITNLENDFKLIPGGLYLYKAKARSFYIEKTMRWNDKPGRRFNIKKGSYMLYLSGELSKMSTTYKTGTYGLNYLNQAICTNSLGGILRGYKFGDEIVSVEQVFTALDFITLYNKHISSTFGYNKYRPLAPNEYYFDLTRSRNGTFYNEKIAEIPGISDSTVHGQYINVKLKRSSETYSGRLFISYKQYSGYIRINNKTKKEIQSEFELIKAPNDIQL